MSDIKIPAVKKTYKEKYYEEKEKKRLKKLERKGATQVSKRVREIMEPKLMSENNDSKQNPLLNQPHEKALGKPLDQVMDKTEFKLDLEKFKGRHLFIATPAYGGLVGEAYLKSMTKIGIMFSRYGLNFTLCTIANESLITRGRNTLTGMFMADPKFTDMIFIDADIHFQAEDVLKLWARIVQNDNIKVAVGAYPKKTINWKTIHEAVKTQNISTEDMPKYQAAYVLNIKAGTDGKIPLLDGMIPVHDGGTGFMIFERSVIQAMMDAWPELHYTNDLGTNPAWDPYMFALFDTMIEPESKRYLSEDYTFCRRCQQLGIQIFMDPTINLDHQGTYLFEGNIGNQFTYGGPASDEDIAKMQKEAQNKIEKTPNQLREAGVPEDEIPE